MYQRRLTELSFLLLISLAVPLSGQESHRSEPATGVLCSRSTFAHGYRHGYEAGYHQGNVDINMGRPARKRFSELRGVPLGYQTDFGPRNSFLYGFQFGLMAGYSDGYSGKKFRAVSVLRAAAAELGSATTEPQLPNPNFDRGVIFGYEDGFGRKFGTRKREVAEALPPKEQCQTPAKGQGPAGAESTEYCDGFRRGHIIGRSDASALGTEHVLLEASK
jgi:hypothetical protein